MLGPTHKQGPSVLPISVKQKEANVKFNLTGRARLAAAGVALLFATLAIEPAAAATLNISAAGFVCTNTGALTCTSTVAFNPAQGSINNGQGTWIANVALPQGAVVTALRVCGHDFDAMAFTGTLWMAALTSAKGHATAVSMASVASTPDIDATICYQTTTIASATIDNTANQYYVQVVLPDNEVEFSTVQIDY
jgi:hypothetical protein